MIGYIRYFFTYKHLAFFLKIFISEFVKLDIFIEILALLQTFHKVISNPYIFHFFTHFFQYEGSLFHINIFGHHLIEILTINFLILLCKFLFILLFLTLLLLLFLNLLIIIISRIIIISIIIILILILLFLIIISYSFLLLITVQNNHIIRLRRLLLLLF